MIRLTANLQVTPWYDRRLWARWLLFSACVLSLASGIGAGALVKDLHETRRLQQEITHFDTVLAQEPSKQAGLERSSQREQVRAVQALLELHRRQPWLQRLHELERLLPDGCILERLEPDNTGTRLTMHGSARSFYDLQQLVERLSGSTCFSNPVLVSHNLDFSGKTEQKIQFVTTARMRAL